MLVTYYERFIEKTEVETKKVLDFLNLDYEPQMTDVSLFRKASGEKWPTSDEIYKSSSSYKKDRFKIIAPTFGDRFRIIGP